jgi:hypothetical protein
MWTPSRDGDEINGFEMKLPAMPVVYSPDGPHENWQQLE